MARLLGIAVLSLLGLLVLPIAVTAQQPTIRYVNGTDPTCGGQSPCFTTIQSAINAAGPRTTVRIQSGIYPEQLQIQKNDFAGAVEADRMVIEADPSDQLGQAVLTGAPGACTGNHAIRLQKSKYVTIRGLTITGTGGQAISLLGGSNSNVGIHIELNRIFGNGSSSCNGGITIARNNPGTLIANNLIYTNGRNGISFIDADGGPHYIINNTIYANQWNGIDVARQHQVTIINNIVNGNGTAAGTAGGRFGVQRESSTSPQPQGITLRNNLVCGNTGGQFNGPALDTTDSGNFTPLGNEGQGVAAKPGCENRDNLFTNRDGANGTPNPTDDDFSLKLNSFAIDIGMDPRTLGLDPAFDPIFIADYFRDNVFRPQDGNGDGVAEFDVGAFEFNGDVTAPQLVMQTPASNAHVRQTITVSAQATDNVAVSAMTLSAGNQTLAPSISPSLPAVSATASALWNTTTVGDGTTSITATATDGSGNSASVSRSVIVDNTPPDTQITGGPTGQITQTTATFTFTGTDNLTPANSLVFAWRIDSGGYSSFSPDTSATISNLTAGSHTFEVKARDLAGNEDATPAGRTFTVQVGPSISNVDPASGVIGTLVTITGSGFEPGTSQVSFNGAAAVIRTITATSITTTVPTNATTGLLTITSSLGSASRNFTVTTSQNFTLLVSPSGAQTIQGGSTGVLIDAIPSNGFSGLIQLATGSLPTGVVANFSPLTLAPNNHSVLALNTTSSTPTGAHAVEIRASSQVDGQSVIKTATVMLNIAAPGQTVLVGQVLDGDDRPLPNVSIKLGGATLVHLGSSDAAGNLFIPLSVTGPQVFLIDGSPANTATTHYPTIPVTIDIQAGAINELGYVPRLRGQPVAKLIPFVPGQATIITDPDLPGFKMTIPAGVQIIGWDGQPNSQFSVTTVSIKRSPLPPLVLPPGLEARETYLFSFGKVGGGVPTGNIPIDLPNNYGGLPGEKADLYYFNEAPDGSAPNQWEKYGTATVSDDGTTLVTDINPATGLQYGIPRFCCGALTPVFNFINRLFAASGGPRDGGKKAGDPVDVLTGFFYVDKTDMVLPGRLPVVVTRNYRTNMSNAGPFGIGTSASFDISLQAPDIFNDQTIVLISPGNKQDSFSRQTNGTYINTASPSLRGAVMTVTGPSDQREYTLRFKDGMVWGFNNSGLISRQSDRNGNAINYFRDNFSRVVRIREPAGRELVLNYGNPGLGLTNIQSITDPIGRQVRYTYDASGRLETVTDPAGGVTRYTYDAADRMLTLRDSRGITFLTNEYDANGRVIRQTQADNGVWTFAYTSSGTYISQAVVTNPRGHSTTYRFNAAGYQVSETNALGQTTTIDRQTGTNLVLSATDPLKRFIRFEHDSLGNITRFIDPTGQALSFTYNPSHNKITSITDSLGNITRLEYDGSGNVTATVDPLGGRTTLVYNAFGQPISTTDAIGSARTLIYDSLGRLTDITDSLGKRSQRGYDLVSRLISQTDPRGKVKRYTYDGLNRITGVTDASSGLTQFGYDSNSNLLAVTDARGNTTAYSYDNMDRLATRIDPVGAIETFQFDGVGNVFRHIDRKGQQSNFTYDALNRRTGANYADGTNANYVYDAVSRFIQTTDSVGGTITNQFDALDRLIAQTTSLGTVSYEYDFLGRRTRMNIPGRSPTTYGYDAASRLRQLVEGTQTVNLNYDSLGRRTQLTLPNGVSTEYQYDSASRVTALIYRNGLATLGDLTYEYDRAGNRVGVGGSFARTSLPTPVNSANYDAANRQLQFGDTTATFDANGNTAAITDPSGVTTLSWDSRNRVVGLISPNTNASFQYDVLGRRIQKAINSQQARNLYDELNPVQETSGTRVQANIRTGLRIDEFFSREDLSSGATSSFLTDPVGSVIALTSPSGNVQTEYTYEAFGKTSIAGVANSSPYQYTGRESDETGIYYYRARYYHPQLARFISEDPFQLSTLHVNANDEIRPAISGVFFGERVVSANLYSYAEDSPILYNDPFGLFRIPPPPGAGELLKGAYEGAAGELIEGYLTSNGLAEMATATYIGGLMGLIPVPPGPMGALVGGITGAITGLTSKAASGDASTADIIISTIAGAAGGALGGALGGSTGAVAGAAIGTGTEIAARAAYYCLIKKKC